MPGRALDEIAERTPGFSGHQQEHWLYHCADGAAFVGRTEVAGETAYRFRCRHCGVGLAYSDVALAALRVACDTFRYYDPAQRQTGSVRAL